MARYIVSIPDWDDLSSKDRWGDFAQLVRVCFYSTRWQSSLIHPLKFSILKETHMLGLKFIEPV